MKERKKERKKDRQTERKKERHERKKERQKEKNQNRKREDFNHLSVHQWLRSAIPDSQQPTSPIGFLFLKLPPPPCAVLLVFFCKIGHDLWPFYSGHCGRPIWGETEEETGVFNSRLYSVTETGVFCDLKPKETASNVASQHQRTVPKNIHYTTYFTWFYHVLPTFFWIHWT